MDQMTPEQKQMVKNLLMLGAFYAGVKVADRLAKLAIFGGLAVMIYRAGKNNPMGFGLAIDPELAVDMLFPKMRDENKLFTKLAARQVMAGLMPQAAPVALRSSDEWEGA